MRRTETFTGTVTHAHAYIKETYVLAYNNVV